MYMASPCDNRLTVNIKKLPIINDIKKGDFLIVETTDGTNIMDFRNFLITLDNTTFGSTFLEYSTRINTISSNLALSVGDLGTKTTTNTANIAFLNTQVETLSAVSETIVNGFPHTADLRISLNATNPVPSVDIEEDNNVMSLYVHKYRGDKVSLYNKDLKRWSVYTLPDTPIVQALETPTGSSLTKDSNYDVFLTDVKPNVGGTTFEVTFDAWNGNQPVNRIYIDGVCVHSSDYSKRLIGCLRTGSTDGTSAQTFGGIDTGGASIKQFIWNAQNQVPVTFACWEKESYEISNNQDWRRVNNNDNFRFSFIAGDRQHVDIIGQIYALSGHEAYTGFVIDSMTQLAPSAPEVTIGGEIFTPHASLSASASPISHLKKTFDTGYHFCQQVEKYTLGGLYATLTVNNNQLQRTGFVVSTHL